MNPKIVKKSEIPAGARRIHLYNVENVLMPRGSMQKESIGPYLLEKLIDIYESWTDEEFGDNPSEEILIKLMKDNLREETKLAWEGLIAHIESMSTD